MVRQRNLLPVVTLIIGIFLARISYLKLPYPSYEFPALNTTWSWSDGYINASSHPSINTSISSSSSSNLHNSTNSNLVKILPLPGVALAGNNNHHSTGKSAETLSHDDISRMFPLLGKDRNSTVNAIDVEIGHRWKTYIFPISGKYNEMGVANYMLKHPGKDCWTKTCDTKTVQEGLVHHLTDYKAEIIIFKKLLASLYFVRNIEDADLVWVPILGAAHVVNGMKVGACKTFISCKGEWFGMLSLEVEKRSDPSKKHLYLASRDFSRTHPFLQQQHEKGNIVVSLGPRSLVVPSLNSETRLQPSHFEGCKPIGDRKYFLLSNFAVRNGHMDRQTINQELDAYTGSKAISRVEPLGSEDLISGSVMTLCPPGDLPFQKRFFDSILSCSIPVVISREVDGIGKTYWSNVKDLGHGEKVLSVQESYPMLPLNNFSYSDLVVEVDGSIVEQGKMMEYLEAVSKDELEAKFHKIEQVRNHYVWDFSGSTPDALTSMLHTLWQNYLLDDG